ncbi:hypothetical protein HUJ04_011407 [Dendroctonus ponderosae]|nr:hypothetical protein HUJ04_011407 [Dendroctonus ponderosae]
MACVELIFPEEDEGGVLEPDWLMETVAVFVRPARTEVIVLQPEVRPLAMVVTTLDICGLEGGTTRGLLICWYNGLKA